MGLFGNKQRTNFRSISKMVEEVIGELNLSVAESRLATQDEGSAWGLMKGSAEVFVFLSPGDPEDVHCVLQVVSPVIKLPDSSSSQTALCRRLLELNARELTGAWFGLKGDAVVILSSRTTEDLNRSEVRDMILRVGYYSDLFDDELVSQFGGFRHSE